MMTDPIYNVRIRCKPGRGRTEYQFGLPNEGVQELVVHPYFAGKPIVLDGRIILPSDIERITLMSLSEEEFTKKPGLLERIRYGWIHAPTDHFFQERGIDVTEEFITGPPGLEMESETIEGVVTLPWIGLFDQLVTNEPLRSATRKRYSDGHYSDAVDAACKSIAESVKKKSGLSSKSDVDLMFKAFQEDSPALTFNSFKSITDKNEQAGYMHMFAGFMRGVRNPSFHELDLWNNPKIVLEVLVIANHLMEKLETATKADGVSP